MYLIPWRETIGDLGSGSELQPLSTEIDHQFPISDTKINFKTTSIRIKE